MSKDYRTRQNGPFHARGRPKKYWKYVKFTPATARAVVEAIAEGAAWSRICGKNGMPSYTSLYAWSARDPDFARAVAQARAMASDQRAEKALAVAEETSAATVQGDRLKVNTLMLHASRLAPKRWGARAVNPGEDDFEPGPEAPRFRIRRFRRTVLPDGSKTVEEVFPGDEEQPS